MSNYSFTILANTRLSTQSRVYPNSCCPDKDLIVLFSRLGGNDRMSLWNITQGTKKWETDIGDSNASCTALAIAWSPDGRSCRCLRTDLTCFTQDKALLLLVSHPALPCTQFRMGIGFMYCPSHVKHRICNFLGCGGFLTRMR